MLINEGDIKTTKKIELELDQDVYNLIIKFCEIIDWPVENFIQKVLKNQMIFYQETLKEYSGVDEIIFYDFIREKFLEKFAKLKGVIIKDVNK